MVNDTTELLNLKNKLQEYCNLPIFESEKFQELAKLQWTLDIHSFSHNGAKFSSWSDAIETLGVYPGFSFVLNPFLSQEKYQEIIDSLSSEEREQRYRSKILVRKIYLEKDGCNF